MKMQVGDSVTIHVRRDSMGSAVHFQSQTERAVMVLEGVCVVGARGGSGCAEPAAQPSAEPARILPRGSLWIERGECRALICSANADPGLRVGFELLVNELGLDRPEPRVVHALCEFIIATGQRRSEVHAPELPVQTLAWLARDARMRDAVELLCSRAAEPWTVTGLARLLGMSRATLARRFQLATGTSPLRFLAAERMRLAARLLLDTDASLAEIAARVGYESEFAFSRAFKRVHGVPPGQFRRGSATLPPRALALAA